MTLSGNILVTGGSGTLGSAIVRTAQRENWDCTFTIYSRSELRQAQMRAKYPHCRYILGDVRDYDRLAAAVAGHDLVIHAAAMKRIPECEMMPPECYATNIEGSRNVLKACFFGGISRVIGISTDKACAAITAYGASKLAMEKAFQAAARGPGQTLYTLVRYGNVVASNGSVIPLWRQQADEGKPITITSREMTRFWMSERDAIRAIEMASRMPTGTMLVPKMGALTIEETARYAVGSAHIDIVETGLRSVEKIHEDLVHPFEPADDQAGNFLLFDGAPGGIRYTSDTAPRLTRDQFLAMLEEAESHE